MEELLKIRNKMVGSWKPNWSKLNESKYSLFYTPNGFEIWHHVSLPNDLSFPNKDMAKRFVMENKELLDKYFYSLKNRQCQKLIKFIMKIALKV